ncbi:hypothetical protein SAMN04488540_1145 [Ferrimonas sediminum]|uniref:DUF469 domain-containing protein n=1 Tax=Ferrimonas sediminum TaxID=718193 RepID=A0A1G8WWA4_9GAMM|nr:hypothetical protein SAMN04488540_1145 [Ferrimonas sediminum]
MTKSRSRRLRKKLYLDEFAIFGFELSFVLDVAENDIEKFLDEFVDVIEDNGLIIGGGGFKEFSAFVCSGRRYGSATDDDRQFIEKWLTSKPSISNVVVGKLVDANYGI